jgi:caa(3)-type oxidase subunit IV
MAEHHPPTKYGSIWWWLLGLTILEILAAMYIKVPLTKMILLVGMALSKAALVAMFFMHLRFERTTLLVIAFTPFLICTFLVFMLMPDLGAIERTSDIRSDKPAASSH